MVISEPKKRVIFLEACASKNNGADYIESEALFLSIKFTLY
jgi:hypothetical protein